MAVNVNNVDILDCKDLDAALALLHFAFRAVVQEPDRLLARRGFGRAHHRVLFFVARARSMPMSRLLAILGVTRQALHRPLSELVARDYIRSEPSPHNRRAIHLSLTAKGRRFEEALSGLQREAFAAAFGVLGAPAERHWRAVMAALARPLLDETAAEFVATGEK